MTLVCNNNVHARRLRIASFFYLVHIMFLDRLDNSKNTVITRVFLQGKVTNLIKDIDDSLPPHVIYSNIFLLFYPCVCLLDRLTTSYFDEISMHLLTMEIEQDHDQCDSNATTRITTIPFEQSG